MNFTAPALTRAPRLALAGLVALPLLGATGAIAAPWVMDKSHAHVTFTVSHLGFSTVHGQFREFDADIDFSPDKVEDSRVNFTIKSASVDTLWDPRDEHLRGPDFFNTEVYPDIRFESTKVEPIDSTHARVEGNLTIIGETQPIVMEAELNNMGPSPFDPSKTIAGFTITGVIDRTAFGMNFAAPAVGAEIPIRVEMEISPGQ